MQCPDEAGGRSDRAALGAEQARLLERLAEAHDGNGIEIEEVRASTALPGDRIFFHLTVLTQVGLVAAVFNGGGDGGPKVLYRLTAQGVDAVENLKVGGGGATWCSS